MGYKVLLQLMEKFKRSASFVTCEGVSFGRLLTKIIFQLITKCEAELGDTYSKCTYK